MRNSSLPGSLAAALARAYDGKEWRRMDIQDMRAKSNQTLRSAGFRRYLWATALM